MDLALNASVLVLLCSYAFLNAAQGLMTGGHALRFDMGIVYVDLVTVIYILLAIRLRYHNQCIEAELIALEVHSWLMSAYIISALLVAFVGAIAVEGTRLDYLTPCPIRRHWRFWRFWHRCCCGCRCAPHDMPLQKFFS